MQFKTKSVKLSDIAIDGGTQQREKINNEIVAEYAEAMRCGAKFPAVTLFFDGVQYWLADGFHRFWASKAVPALDILADVREGTKRDARLFSAGANGTHGMRLSNADKRRSVLVLLLDKEWSAWSDNQIAKHCHVTHPFVGKLRSEINGAKKEPRVVTVTTTATEAAPVLGAVSELPKKEAAQGAQERLQPPPLSSGDEAAMHAEMVADAMDALREENESLRNQVAAMLFDGTDEEKAEHLDRLNHLTAENKRLEIMNRGLTEARDRVMRENVSLRKQAEYAAKKLKALDRAAA